MSEKKRIGVLASGNGTDFQSIIDAVESGHIGNAEIALLVCNKEGAYCIQRAKEYGIPFKYIDHRKREREDFDREVVGNLRDAGVDVVVLAGFMRLLSPYFINEYRGRIINIHPALLPSFPGTHAHRDTLAYGVKVSGCTVHFVDENMDAGPVILQEAVDVFPDDTEDTLSARILEKEHVLLPMAIKLYLEDKLEVRGRKVLIRE